MSIKNQQSQNQLQNQLQNKFEKQKPTSLSTSFPDTSLDEEPVISSSTVQTQHQQHQHQQVSIKKESQKTQNKLGLKEHEESDGYDKVEGCWNDEDGWDENDEKKKDMWLC